MQGAFCRAPNGGRRGGLSHRRWRARCEGSRAWTRPLALRPLLQESDGPRRAWEWAAQSICEWARRACASGQNCHPRRDAKNANADRLVTLHAKFISSHGWLAQGKLMAPTFLVAI